MLYVRIFLDCVGALLLLTALPLMVEVMLLSFAAALPSPRRDEIAISSIKLAVVVPAHNEEALIEACIASLLASKFTAAVYIVAHNCTDATASKARAAGAVAFELNESSGHGKGAALDYGFRRAIAAGADAVLVVDADSIVSANLLERVAGEFEAGAAAIQCRYVVANEGETRKTRLMALAFLGFNVLRPKGRARLGLSCGIFGNGFGLSASTLQHVPYVAHSIVEDLEYHLLLLQAGLPVTFINDASVFGEMPVAATAAGTQRARWEGGRMMMRHRFAFPLLNKVLHGQWRFAEPLLDLLSVPVATGALLLLLSLIAPASWIRVSSLLGLASLMFYALLAAAFGTQPLEKLKALAFAPFYLAFKVAMIPRTRRAARKDAAWVRTERNGSKVR